MNKLILASLLALLATQQAVAAPPHVHGIGHLNVVVDKDMLSIALEMPLDEAVGFEHPPRNAKEKAAFDEAAKLLDDGDKLFTPSPDAACRLQSASVKLPYRDAKPDPQAKPQEHADVDASYEFRCAKPAALKGFETQLFRWFKRLQHLGLERVGPVGQGAAKLSPKQAAVSW